MVSKMIRETVGPTAQPPAKFSNKKFVFHIAIFSVLLSSVVFVQTKSQGSSLLSHEELKNLAREINVAENRVSNIKLESEAWEEHGPSASGPWERTPVYWSSTAWYSGDWSRRRWNPEESTFESYVKGKARVDVHREVLEWQDGPAPYAESSYCAGFDGKHGRAVIHNIGHDGKMRPVRTGEITSDPPRILTSGMCGKFTGIGSSLQFFEGEIYSFSKLFQLGGTANSSVAAEPIFTHEEFRGADCIKIGTKSVTYWIDPFHGFALRGSRSIASGTEGPEELVRLMEVNKLEELASGVWWPTEVFVVSRPTVPGKPWRRFVWRASRVVANDSAFDEIVFTTPLPEGYLINDKVTNMKYKVGEK